MQQPLLKLPVELLGMVLQHLVDPLDHSTDGIQSHWNHSVQDHTALIPVAKTCRHLREIVRALPPLRTSIVIQEGAIPFSRQAVSNMSNRHAALNVHVSLVCNISQAFKDWYASEAHRVKELHLSRLGYRALDCWAELLPRPSPELRTMSLSSIKATEWLPANGQCYYYPFPDAPKLAHLTLKCVTFVPQNGIQSLTHLALIDVFLPCALLMILKRYPQLESLVVSNVRERKLDHTYPQDGAGNNSDDNEEPDLPRLRRITVHAKYCGARQLMLLPGAPDRAFQLLDASHRSDLLPALVATGAPDAHTLYIAHRAEIGRAHV